MRRLLWIVAVGLVLFGGLQFVRPTLTNPPVTAEIQASPELKAILRQSCYDCHSNETKLAWFDHIVPAYWIVVRDVRRGRTRLNFSEIGAKPAAQQLGALFEGLSQAQLGAMPLPSYRRMHPESVLTEEHFAVWKKYLTPSAPQAAASESVIAAADTQFRDWIARQGQATAVQPAPNGIAFLPEYKDWKAISSTERFDNQTLRQVLANDVAVRAIAEGHINPWPDGAAFAKVAWQDQPDGKGYVGTGAFYQVEFMIKGREKYAATKGWGWARWRGADLKPYGANADFTSECVGCHMPLRDNDFVFTPPIPRIASTETASMNRSATLHGTLPEDPLRWRVITSAVDRPTSSMWTLFGNDPAIQYARSNSGHEYPAGSMLALVTWAQQDDPRWFGARIPSTPRSVEFVSLRAGAPPVYQRFEGAPLKEVSMPDNTRATYLLSQRAAVMP